jgi:hypothetical protein
MNKIALLRAWFQLKRLPDSQVLSYIDNNYLLKNYLRTGDPFTARDQLLQEIAYQLDR